MDLLTVFWIDVLDTNMGLGAPSVDALCSKHWLNRSYY